MDVKFGPPGLEVNIAERLKPADFKLRKLNKNAPIPREPLKVDMALPIQIGAHLLDLKVGHIADAPAQRALMAPRAAKLKTLNQSSVRKKLARRADNLGQKSVIGKNAHHVCAARHPDCRLVPVGIQLTLRVNLEKLRMQRSLK